MVVMKKQQKENEAKALKREQQHRASTGIFQIEKEDYGPSHSNLNVDDPKYNDNPDVKTYRQNDQLNKNPRMRSPFNNGMAGGDAPAAGNSRTTTSARIEAF